MPPCSGAKKLLRLSDHDQSYFCFAFHRCQVNAAGHNVQEPLRQTRWRRLFTGESNAVIAYCLIVNPGVFASLISEYPSH